MSCHVLQHLIWVCTICSCQSVQTHIVNTVIFIFVLLLSFFFFKKTCCEYCKKCRTKVFLNEYPQHMFSLRYTGNICKKNIHDVGTKVFLHTYKNERERKKKEWDKFINKIKEVVDFKPRTFCLGGERSPDWATGAFPLAPPPPWNENYILLSSYIFLYF